MNATHPPLVDLQNWLLSVIIQPEMTDADAIGQAILPSHQQSPTERLAVYQQAYLARLLSVLRELFPCTRFAVGDELFDDFAAGYLRRYPPHSYTLGRLADKWVDYLDESRPADADWSGFVVELARLEQAIDRIFDGPGPEQLPPFILPPNPTDDLQLTLAPGFELHAFAFPVSAYFTAWKADTRPAWPERGEQFVALFRRDYIVRRLELDRAQYDVLSRLARGQTLAESLQGAADASPEQVRGWFTSWAAAGFFQIASEPSH
jgi:hypothetical protein